MLTTFQKSILGVLAAGFILVALVIAARGSAGATVPMNVTVPGAGAIAPGIITTGDATVKVRPDTAILSIGVTAQAATAADAQAQVAQHIAAILGRAKAFGIADKDIGTSSYQIQPQYAYDQGKAPRITGYQATQMLSLTLHKVDDAARALDTLVAGDATNATVRFTIDDPKSAQAEARQQAVADARSKAQAMAQAAGVGLGQPVSVSDVGTPNPMPYSSFDVSRNVAMPAAAPTQLPVSDLDVTVRVQVQFAIQ